ncbi:MAG: class I SAM-dependent methyltransferase [Actinomycetota bacterium]|nr:class I SAM-dependent methyltransferase [Actinomycetota bacterium]
MKRYGPATYGDAFADVYDDWYADLGDADVVIRRVVELADGGPVLELGCGTGRLALPIADAGPDVVAIDASEAMLERLRAKPASRALDIRLADMATFDVLDRAPFGLVLCAFNTFFNLPTVELQEQCLYRIAGHLRRGGRFVIECVEPGDEPDAPRSAVEPSRIDDDRVVLSVSRQDPTTQTITGQHVEISEAGIRLRPWRVRYCRTTELDAMAARAGLELEHRAAGWADEPFDESTSTVHVSTYRRTGGP